MLCVLEALVESADRLAALEKTATQGHKRLDALEARRVMSFDGAFDPGHQYGAGAVVQRGGAVWVSLVSTAEAPGSSSAWRRLAGDIR
jgi:hypothetical protein